jgi:hypothetical protein
MDFAVFSPLAALLYQYAAWCIGAQDREERIPATAIISKRLEGFFQNNRGMNTNSVMRAPLQTRFMQHSGATR